MSESSQASMRAGYLYRADRVHLVGAGSTLLLAGSARRGGGNPRPSHRLVGRPDARPDRPHSHPGAISAASCDPARLVLTMLVSADPARRQLAHVHLRHRHRAGDRGEPRLLPDAAGERLPRVGLPRRAASPAHYPALALVAIGVAIPFVAKGEFTWLVVALPDHVRLYGLVRKMAPVDSLTGLDRRIAAPARAVGRVSCSGRRRHGVGHFGTSLYISLLLMFGGIVTVVPLLTYTLSIRRLPLIAVSFIQFLSPTVQLLLAVFVLGEVVGWEMWAAIGCVWAAVLIFIADAVVRVRARRRAEASPSVGLDRPTPLPRVPVTR